MSIEPIVETIKLLLNKNRKGMVRDSFIKTAIQNAERDLYNELLNEFRKTGVVPVKLYPFVGSSTASFVGGETTLATAQDLVSCEIQNGSYYWDARVARNNKEWTSRKFSDLVPDPDRPDNPLHKYMKAVTLNNVASLDLPSAFIKEVAGFVTINGEKFVAILLQPDRWGTKDLSDILPDPQKNPEPNVENLSEEVIAAASLSTGSTTSPTGLVKALSFTAKDVSGKEWEGFLVPFSDYKSRSIKDMIDDKEIKKHISVIDSTITLTSGTGNLPNEFIKDKGVFYADGEEGLILDDEDYIDRANSDLLPPDAENPIARIKDGEIEVLPVSITSITLPHYAFPTAKTPMGSIGDGKFHVTPAPTGEVTLRFLKFPTERRPVFKIEGSKVYVDPVQANDFTFVYLEYPTEKAPLVRFTNGVVEVAPASLATAAAKFNYIKRITPSVYVWGTSGRDVTFTSGTSEFNDDAVSDIVAKSLKYLGVSMQDAGSVQFEKILSDDNTQ